jgi:basic amino acid/polyamine antiporter, APA family
MTMERSAASSPPAADVRPDVSSSKKFTQENLKQSLGFNETLSLVIGTVIGTGVFLKAAVMTQEVGSAFWVLSAWFAAGILSLAGALCFAELGSRFPEAGGEYIYLREAFGELPAFLNGWMLFGIGNPGSIAAYAVGLMTFLNGVFHFSLFKQTFSACVIIVAFTLINCATVRAAGMLHTAMTVLKVLMVVGFTLAILTVPTKTAAPEFTIGAWPGLKAFGAAMLAALWAYDGWNGMPMAASEVKEPQKNIPRALIFGMLAVMLIYMLTNLSFFITLPISDVVTSNSPSFPNALPVATKAALATMGPLTVAFASILLGFSAVVSLNGSILTGARVPFAMARDRLLFKSLGTVHHRTRTPVVSVLVQGLIAIGIACSGTFDQLTDYVMFASWIFYGLSVLALFVLRKRGATQFKVPFYPVIPGLFLLASIWLIINTLLTAFTESLLGLLFLLAGLPVYFYFRFHFQSRTMEKT